MRVLYIGNKLSQFGFTPTGVEFLGELLSRQGFDVCYGGAKRGQLARLVDMVRAATRRQHYDVVLIDLYSTRAFYYAILVAWAVRFFTKPYVLILRGGDLPARYKRSPQLTKQIMQNAARVVSVSRYLQEAFHSLRKIEFIPNFIPIQKYPYKQRMALRPRLLWVRSLHRIYNPELAVRVVARLCTRLPDTTLTMVGPDKDGSMKRVHALAEELGVANRVEFTGRLPKEDWIRLAAEFDIFLNTTDFDNMPVSVVEAMALGLPVVSTKAGGMSFLIEHDQDGLLLERGDVDGFVNAIEGLVTRPGWGMELARHARAKAETFAESEVARQWCTLLDSIEKTCR
ncbi:MAG: glycosyltransferase family 4 protein [Cyclobacteriaceae bacterium]|nr:glycosyltransferase family 4 protein [Cyclobacteriaceae bacterium]